MCGHFLRSVFYSSPTSAGKDKPVVCSFLTWHTGVALSSINCLDRINRPSALTEVFEGRDLGRSMNFCITFELPRACYQSAACRWNWTGNHHNYIELPSLATINGASRVLCTLRIRMKDTEILIHSHLYEFDGKTTIRHSVVSHYRMSNDCFPICLQFI